MTPLEELSNLISKYEALAFEAREVLDHLIEWKRLEERDNAEKPWSAQYPQCVVCGTRGTKRYQVHSSKGRCARCYARERATEKRRAKGIQPKKVNAIPKPEPTKEASLDWDGRAIPVDCAWCFLVFEPGDERVETEDEQGKRIDWHSDCYTEMLQH